MQFEFKGKLYISLIFSTIIFEVLALLVLGGYTVPLDLSIDHVARGCETIFLVSFFRILFTFLTSETLAVLAVCIGIYLVVRKMYVGAFKFVFGAFLASGASLVYKHFFVVARPLVPLGEASGFSFPSGHAILATLLFVFLIHGRYLLHNKMFRDVTLWLSGVALVLVVVGRIYMHVHWFSDVVAGLALGNAIAIISIFVAEAVKVVFNQNTEKLL
jgi:undecaprenyl-diphosphatase